MNPKEAGKQKFDRLKKQALLVLTTAFRAPLMLMMGCGYIIYSGTRQHLHDRDGRLIVEIDDAFHTEPYNTDIHGDKIEFIEEGEVVSGIPNSTDGKKPIHRHHASSSTGPYDFQYE